MSKESKSKFHKTAAVNSSYNFSMHGPFIIRNLIEPKILGRLQQHSEVLKNSSNLEKDVAGTNRYYVNDDPFFKKLHFEVFTSIAIKHFKEHLEPTYNFASFYEQSKGILPLHADKAQCYLTIDLCLNQFEPWPIYINDEDVVAAGTYIDFSQMESSKQELYKTRSKPYMLNPGDALFYSGTKYPHWRPKIQENNFCDVVLFHFIASREGVK